MLYRSVGVLAYIAISLVLPDRDTVLLSAGLLLAVTLYWHHYEKDSL